MKRLAITVMAVLVAAFAIGCGGEAGETTADLERVEKPTCVRGEARWVNNGWICATTTTTTRKPTTTTTTTTTTIPVVRMPSGDPVFPGYPLLVPTSSVDSRVANWANSDQLVALAPGVYSEYNPLIPELQAYLDGPNDGDCMMRDRYFPMSGGACWSGVGPGSAEPAL